jgi:hypothetical protein
VHAAFGGRFIIVEACAHHCTRTKYAGDKRACTCSLCSASAGEGGGVRVCVCACSTCSAILAY